MTLPRERTLTSLNVVVDEQALELTAFWVKRELQNLNKNVDDRFDTLMTQLDILIKNMNQTQGSDKGKRIIQETPQQKITKNASSSIFGGDGGP